MSADLRAHIQQIFLKAVERVDPRRVVRESIALAPGGQLLIPEGVLDLSDRGVYVIAIGKAACAMARGAGDMLGSALVAGISVTKSESCHLDSRIAVMRGSHPVPDARSLEAGKQVVEFARSIPQGSVVLCLISGGGSALVEHLRGDVSLAGLRSVTSALLQCGASIRELNAVRSRLSQIKAGGLLNELRHTTVVNLIVSDVLGDDPRAIASGLTVPSGESDPEDVLAAYGVPFDLPSAQPEVRLDEPPTHIVANLSTAIDAAVDEARRLGYPAFVLGRSLDGEAREAGRLLAGIVADAAWSKTSWSRPVCLLAGGELVVTVHGDGQGGRNTEAALGAALRLRSTPGAAIGFLATDGDDGATAAAGAIVEGSTIGDSDVARAREALANNDSFTFLAQRGASWSPGPTGTNVNDLVIALVAGPG
jgi:hydroxypyruvate reductase